MYIWINHSNSVAKRRYHIVVLILHSFKIEGFRKINFTTPSIPRDFERGFLLVFRVISSQFSKCVSRDLTECGRCYRCRPTACPGPHSNPIRHYGSVVGYPWNFKVFGKSVITFERHNMGMIYSPQHEHGRVHQDTEHRKSGDNRSTQE